MLVSNDAELNAESPLVARTRGLKRRRLADSLRKMVAQMRVSDRFPSVAELEKHYQVSTSTVEAAIRELQADGLIVRRRGSGTFVADAGLSSTPAARSRTGHLVITSNRLQRGREHLFGDGMGAGGGDAPPASIRFSFLTTIRRHA